MIKDVCQFNQLFQLYQKDDRYNLYIHDFPKNEFVQLFFNDTIEDLHVEYYDYEAKFDRNINDYNSKFADFFTDSKNLKWVDIKNVSGYFPQFDFYFMTEGDTFIFNYIHRNFLSQLIDILLNELDCNFISRLKTELLINLEYD